ncbi:MAG: dihydroneopterin aldolase [Candidatus Rokuibacteriota bacterium]
MLTGQWLVIEGIAFQCVIGVTERERRGPQDIVVNVHVKTDFTKAAASDQIHDTVDYRLIARCVMEQGSSSSFQLVETLAAHLARSLFAEFPNVQAARIEVEKVGALTAARSVKAVLTARRPAG